MTAPACQRYPIIADCAAGRNGAHVAREAQDALAEIDGLHRKLAACRGTVWDQGAKPPHPDECPTFYVPAGGVQLQIVGIGWTNIRPEPPPPDTELSPEIAAALRQAKMIADEPVWRHDGYSPSGEGYSARTHNTLLARLRKAGEHG